MLEGKSGDSLFFICGEHKWLSEEEYINHTMDDGSPADENTKIIRKTLLKAQGYEEK